MTDRTPPRRPRDANGYLFLGFVCGLIVGLVFGGCAGMFLAKS